jgi:hypothetical protein
VVTTLAVVEALVAAVARPTVADEELAALDDPVDVVDTVVPSAEAVAARWTDAAPTPKAPVATRLPTAIARRARRAWRS